MTAEKRRNSKTARIEPLTQGRPASTPTTLYHCWRIYGTRKEILCTRQLLLSKLLISSARAMSLYCEECVYIHIPDWVETVFELPCLPNNTARETYLHKSGAVWRIDWICHCGAGLAVTGPIRDISQNVLQSSFQTNSSRSHQLLKSFFLTVRIPRGGLNP